jgi:hypothetical protein
VKREQRHLDRECEREREEEPELRAHRDLEGVEPQQVEGVGAAGPLGVHPREAQDGDQHEHAASHRIEDELDGGVDAPVVAPDPDQEIHRDEHCVPEHVEEEQVERDEHTDHRGLEGQDEQRELLDLLRDRLPGRQQRDRRQEPREHDEQQADAVDPDKVVDPKRRDPRDALHHLKVGRRRVESRPEQQGQPEDRKRGDERHLPDDPIARAVAVRDEQKQPRRRERQRNDGREDRKRHTPVRAAASNATRNNRAQ